jgi:hypothetical protein
MTTLKTQIGGSHYKTMAIQPVEFIHKNNIGFIEGSVIKYVTRWRSKNGVEDLRKAKHFLEILIEQECSDVKTAVENAKREISRIDAIGQNGGDGLHYTEMN